MELDLLTEKIIGCAIEVRRQLGVGLLESVYESALRIELDEKGILYERQKALPVSCKGRVLGEYQVRFADKLQFQPPETWSEAIYPVNPQALHLVANP